MINTFIISYNRLSFLKQQVEFLSQNPMLQLHIVDNGSTYPPLIEYLNNIDCPVTFMPDNQGHQVIWKRNKHPQVGYINSISEFFCKDEPYIVTDPDIIPEDPNFHELLLQGLEKFPSVNKIGLGLRTDDIPESYPLREQILNHENEVLERKYIDDDRFVIMPVDTTLAIYRSGYHEYSVKGALRTTRSLAKHLSWYITADDMKTEENKFYFESIKDGSTHWSYLQAKYGKPIRRKK